MEEHDKLIDFVSGFYPEKDRAELSAYILGDQNVFDKSLQKLHKEKGTDFGTFDEFRSHYVGEFGDPFKKKSSSNGSLDSSGGPTNVQGAEQSFDVSTPGNEQRLESSYAMKIPFVDAETARPGVELSPTEKIANQEFSGSPGWNGLNKDDREKLVGAPFEGTRAWKKIPQEEKNELTQIRNKMRTENFNVSAYESIKERRNGDYALTGDQHSEISEYDQARNKRKTLIEKALWNKKNVTSNTEGGTFHDLKKSEIDEEGKLIGSTGAYGDTRVVDATGEVTGKPFLTTAGGQKTLTEYETQMGNIQADINDLSGAIPYAKGLVEKKYGEKVWEETQKRRDKIELLTYTYKSIEKLYDPKDSSEENKSNYNSLVEVQSSINALTEEDNELMSDPLMQEYGQMADLYERNYEKAKGLLKQDNYKLVDDLISHYDKMKKEAEIQSLVPVTPLTIHERMGRYGLQILSKSIAKVGASVGAGLDIVENLTTGDDKYTLWDEIANDFLMDFEQDVERTYPTPTKWARPLSSSTVKLNGFEYDIKNGEIQAKRLSNGMVSDAPITEEEKKEVLATGPVSQRNWSGLPYKAAELGVDLGIQILITKGVGGTLGGSKLAYQVGVTSSVMGQMTSDLYKEGIELFDGDKKKAGKYALGTGFAIGAIANISGLEAKLAGGSTKVIGEAGKGSIKSVAGRRLYSAFTGGLGEVSEESFFEQLGENAVRGMLNAPEKWMDNHELFETSLLSFAAGGVGNVLADRGELNDIDKANLLVLAENKDKAPEFIDQHIPDKDEASKALLMVDKVAGKMEAAEIKEDPDAEVAGAMYEHTKAETELEKAKASKIEPLIAAKEEQMEQANEKVAEVLDLKMEVPVTKEAPKMKKKPQPTKEFESLTIEDELAEWFRSGGRIGKDDYVSHGDVNNITDKVGKVRVGLYKTVLKSGKGTDNIDTLAQDIAERTERDPKEVIKDIVDFIENKSPDKHIEETVKARKIAESYNMNVDEYLEYESKREELLDKYVGDVETSEPAKEIVGDILMDAQKDGKVDMGLLEPKLEGLEAEPAKILSDAINKAKDQALSIEQAKPEEVVVSEEIPVKEKPEILVEAPAEVIKEPKEDIKEEAPKEPEAKKEPTVKEIIEKEPENIVELSPVSMGKVQKAKWKEFLNETWKKIFNPEGILPKISFKLNIGRQSRINTEMQVVKFAVTDLFRAIKNTYSGKNKLNDAQMKELGDHLKNPELIDATELKWKDGTAIPNDIMLSLKGMRRHVDKLSQTLMDAGFLADEVKAIIDENLNVYLHRSYRVHTDPDWIKKVVNLDQFIDAVNWMVKSSKEKLTKLEANRAKKEEEIAKMQEPDFASKKEDYFNKKIDKINASKLTPESLSKRNMYEANINALQDGSYIPNRTDIINEQIDNINQSIKQKTNDRDHPRNAVLAMLERQATKMSVTKVAKKGKLGEKDLGIFAKKKEIPVEVRELFGEYTDPISTYSHSVFKMIHLIENQKFLEQMREKGLGVFLWEPDEKHGDFTSPITSKGDETLSPLDGLYTTPEIAKAFREFNNPMKLPWGLMKAVQASAYVKYAKTILSPATQTRNFVQNTWYHWNNGHFFGMFRQGFKGKGGDSLSIAWANMEGWAKGGEAAREGHLKLLRLGIIHESSTYGEMRALLDDFTTNPGMYNPDDPAFKRGRKKIGKKAEGLYAFGDDAHKAFAYFLERDRYAPALMDGRKYDSLNPAEQEEVDQYVAGIIRDTYQTYSMLSPYIKAARLLPVTGSFISFPAELFRNYTNNIKIAAKEIRSDNKRLRRIGYGRAAGAATLAGTMYASQYFAFWALKMLKDDDDDKGAGMADFRWFMPSYDTNTIMIPYKKDGGEYKVMSVANTVPQGLVYNIANVAMDGRRNAGERIDGMIRETMGNFIALDILYQTAGEAISGEKKGGKKIVVEGEKHGLAKRARHLSKAFEPGGVRTIGRIGKSYIDPETPYGTMSPTAEWLAVMPGIRVMNIKIEQSAYFHSRDFGETKRTSLKLYTDKLKYPKYIKMNPKERAEALKADKEYALDAYNNMMKDAKAMYKAAIKYDGDPKILQENFKNNGFNKSEINAIVGGYDYNPLLNK